MSATFWNEAIETMSAPDVRRLEDDRLAEQIAYDYATSPFYRDAARRRRRPPGRTSGTARTSSGSRSWRRPRSPSRRRAATLLGVNQCAPLDGIVRIQATGGTTGQPMRIGLTRRDIADYGEMGARALWTMGCRPGDDRLRVHELQPLLGRPQRPPDVRDARRGDHPVRRRSQRAAADDDGRHRRDPVGIWATPSYAVRLAEVAAGLGIEPRSVGLAQGYFSGEAGLQVPGYRERIEETWGMVARDQYGTGELGLHSGECDERDGVHFGGTGFAIAELIDPDSGAVLPFEDGQQGEVVYTSIRREACPLLRMRSHDLMQVFTEPCRCGRTGFRFRDPRSVGRHVHRQGRQRLPARRSRRCSCGSRPQVTGEFQVVIDRPPPIDYPVPITVEVARDVPAARYDELARRGRGPAPGRAELHGRRERWSRRAASAGERKTRRVVRSYRGEVD